jgi:Zn finger protein HypA/HybF involved in hydrogenase expression
MPKSERNEIAREAFICPSCGGNRFQVHECCTIFMTDTITTVVIDELKAQCLKCHAVHILPVTGRGDYIKE